MGVIDRARAAACLVALAAAWLMAAALSVHAEELRCAAEAVTARGVGFYPSPELSMEAAEKEWQAKALTIYGDAKWETAKEPQMSCVNQGLYSNCTVSAVPCGATPAAK
jgi:hypothetical protein